MRTRTVFFWLLVLLCLVTIPVIILYSFGYRYNLEQGIFVYTGSITVKPNPQAVNIVLDGESVDSRVSIANNSYHVGGLRPGQHVVTVSAPGFRSWTKETTVSSGLSTEFWNTILTRETYPIERYPADHVRRIYRSPKAEIFAIVSDRDGEMTVSVFNTGTGESRQVFSSREYAFDLENHENVEWSPDGGSLIVIGSRDGRQVYFVVDVETTETVNLKDISGGFALRMVRWDPSRNDTVVYVDGDTLWKLSLGSAIKKTILAEHVSGYDLSDSHVYFVELENSLVWRAPISDPENRTQITTGKPDDLVDTRSYSLVVYDRDRFYLIDYQSGSLYLFNDGEQGTVFGRISDRVQGAQFSNDGKKLLYWTDREVHVRFMREWPTQPSRVENQDIDVARLSQPIDNVQWAKDYEHVVFSSGSTVKLTELDNRDRITLDILVLAAPPAQIVSDFDNNILYFVGPSDPDSTSALSSILFPESTGVFGFLGG